jgi:hypothetical protein
MARRKMTDAADFDASELPELTPQQMGFVEGLLAGKTATDAYRTAYDCSNSGKNSVWVDASRLKSNPKVALWLDAAKATGFGRVSCTFEDHMRELERLRGIAERSGNIGAAVQAEQLRGKVAGHYVDRIEDVTKTHDPAETINEIAALMGEDYAQAKAKELGIPWQPDAAEQRTRH